eukprot:TRINITY_DN65423_c0_g1_i1.p1 TRINITY_DN65423_c0_g1~~TRINITY_DN65423_c0_g1_i1.p1  ORF type:complete len:302 (-),score=60.33 TRINITY_DN65423_c0_g1_i1:49-909(-)
MALQSFNGHWTSASGVAWALPSSRLLRKVSQFGNAAGLKGQGSSVGGADFALSGTLLAFCAGACAGRSHGSRGRHERRPSRAAEEVVGRAGLLRMLRWPLPLLGRRPDSNTATLERGGGDGGQGTSPEEELALLSKKGPLKVAMLGTRDCPFQHQQEIELLSEARVSRGDHIYTSGSSGTNSSVIRGALRARRPNLLTVVLPQSFDRQSKESQALLKRCIDAGADVCPMPMNDSLPLAEAAAVCNTHVLEKVDRLVAFASHESSVYLSLIDEAKERGVLATPFFMD